MPNPRKEGELRAKLAKAGDDARAIIKDCLEREARLRRALTDLIEAAESRVPGDDALWESALEEARAALSKAGNTNTSTEPAE